jgi:hypothetical protein
MATQDFTTAFLTDKTPQQAYDAVNDVRAWWTGEIEGNSSRVGDEFTYRYKEYHYSKHKLAEMIPGKKIVWQTEEARLNFVEDKGEWNGSTIVFDITKKDGQTEVRFTHHGLVPGLECFDGCSQAWTYYVTESLRNFIGTGKELIESAK